MQQVQRDFSIKFNSPQEMVTIRETLRALGSRVFYTFTDNSMDGYSAVVSKGGEICRGYNDRSSRVNYPSLQAYLDARFTIVPQKTPTQLELEKLEASAVELNTRIAALKATI